MTDVFVDKVVTIRYYTLEKEKTYITYFIALYEDVDGKAQKIEVNLDDAINIMSYTDEGEGKLIFAVKHTNVFKALELTHILLPRNGTIKG